MKALFEKEKKYWSQKLEPEDRIITLPYTTHVPKDVAANADYATYTLTFLSDVSSRISSITGGNPWAVYMVLLAGVNSLLHKYTGEEHVLLGIPVAETGSGAAKPLNSMLILKSTLNTASTFKSLLSQIKAGISEAIEH
ncbi:condensation domain-containing protein, partial [Paenibacillus massiliensis]|uniref:condensation domain-containing protein n=1 Tax=Paenibacillus massiliensis TaxID=225917 RepID=UPI0005644B8E